MTTVDQSKSLTSDSRTMRANSIEWLPAVVRGRLIGYAVIAAVAFLLIPGIVATVLVVNRTIVAMAWIAPWFLALAWLQMNSGGGGSLIRRIGFRLLCKRFGDPRRASETEPTEGQVVWQAGSVVGPGKIPGLLEAAQGVFRRVDLVITIERSLMKPLQLAVTHQTGEPFVLVDPKGNRISAQVDDHSFLFVEPRQSAYLQQADAVAFLARLNVLDEIGYSNAKVLSVTVSEYVVKPSDPVFILGRASTSVDQNVTRLHRDPPIAKALGAAPDVPLLIVPADARSATASV